jgi:hypothetical protein
VYPLLQSADKNQRSPREEAPRLASSNSALSGALNSVSIFDDLNPPFQPLKPLAVSVRTAAALLGVGRTTMWSLVGPGGSELEVLRIGRRTLVTLASLERLVAKTSTHSRQANEDTPRHAR